MLNFRGLQAVVDILIYNGGPFNKNKWNTFLKHHKFHYKFSSDYRHIRDTKLVVIPGVGNFDATMKALITSGYRDELLKEVLENKIKILGVCVGMQVLYQYSEEGDAQGLGLIDGSVKRLLPSNIDRVPNVGWSCVNWQKSIDGLVDDAQYYFSHSFAPVNTNKNDVLAYMNANKSYTVVTKKKNIFGCQFHPEISRHCGMQFLNYVTD